MKKVLSLVLAFVMVLAMGAMAFADSADSTRYAQFLNASNTAKASMAQLAVKNQPVTVTTDVNEDTEEVEYTVTFDIQSFDLNMGYISGSGYMKALSMVFSDESVVATVANTSDGAAGTVTMLLSSDQYNTLLNGNVSATVTSYVEYNEGQSMTMPSTALFTLATSYLAYAN